MPLGYSKLFQKALITKKNLGMFRVILQASGNVWKVSKYFQSDSRLFRQFQKKMFRMLIQAPGNFLEAVRSVQEPLGYLKLFQRSLTILTNSQNVYNSFISRYLESLNSVFKGLRQFQKILGGLEASDNFCKAVRSVYEPLDYIKLFQRHLKRNPFIVQVPFTICWKYLET